MSASMQVFRLSKICSFCQRHCLARKNKICSPHVRSLSAEVAFPQDEEPRTNTVKSKPELKSFPKGIGLDSTVESDLTASVLKPRKHPGRFAGKTWQLPAYLEDAANTVVEKNCSNLKSLKEKAEALQLFIATRVAPKEWKEHRQQVQKIYNRLRDKAVEKHEAREISLDEEDLQRLHDKFQKQAEIEAQRAGFTWKPLLMFNTDAALVYMVARLAQNYSVLRQIFNEMKLRDPSFVPGAVYNYGSGLGSVVWAGNSVWHTDIFEYYCVDQSGDMNTLARLLLQGGSEDHNMFIPGVYFRQFHSSDKSRYKLVVCAYTLLEMGHKKERLSLAASLWNKTDTYLVLVEIGNAAGYKVILEARDHILNLKDKKQKKPSAEELEGHVFSPCPHDSVCPKQEYHKNYCHFPSFYKPLHLGQGPRREDRQTEKYSYVVLKKGPRQAEDSWPRITSEIQKRRRHLHCHLCCADGSLHHLIVSKKSDKYSRYLYKCARMSQWGDKLPVTWSTLLTEVSGRNNTGSSTEDSDSFTECDCEHVDTYVDSKNSSDLDIDYVNDNSRGINKDQFDVELDKNVR